MLASLLLKDRYRRTYLLVCGLFKVDRKTEGPRREKEEWEEARECRFS
jgi:hypothetical protein